MAEAVAISLKVSGAKETKAALERLARQSPARARRAVNRSIGVARQRVIKTVAGATGIPKSVLGGRKSRIVSAAGGRRPSRGYIKQVKASRRRAQGALVGLIAGVRFSNIGRKRLGRSRPKPGGVGEPFNATTRSGHRSLFQRHPPLSRVSRGSSAGTRRANLPIREVVIPIEPWASRAIQVHMRRVARTVYPAKLWEELKKSIKPGR